MLRNVENVGDAAEEEMCSIAYCFVASTVRTASKLYEK